MVAARRLAWIAGVFALIASVGLAYAAYLLADYSWNQVAEYRTPFGDYDRGWTDEFDSRQVSASQDTTTSPRVVFVLIDGLTLDASRELMSSLNTAREYGADMVATTCQPSLSYPTWTNVLSGATPDVSGVTTNWFDAKVPVETLFDVMYPRPTIVAATEDFDELYDVSEVATDVYLEPWDDTRYLGGILVDEALRMSRETSPALAFVYIPDADEISHEHGPESEEYAAVVAQIDRDVQRLIAGFQDDRTMFVITADHGHIDGGGHGGWEEAATRVPAVFFGPGARFDSGEISQSDIAPTIAGVLDANTPAWATGRVLTSIVEIDDAVYADAQVSYRRFAEHYAKVIDGTSAQIGGATTYDEIDGALADVREQREDLDREVRVPTALGVAGAALVALLILLILSWRAFLSAGAGTVAYYLVYNALFFFVHGHQWSLSAFNTEKYLQTFFNLRMVEAAVAGLIAVAVAAFVYPMLRREPKGPRGSYLGGWLSLGPAVVLAVQATLLLQVAWFLWAWGAQVVWRLPDLKWGFKYDLDLIQITALAVAALLGPVVTYLVGRYHPKVRRAQASLAAGTADSADI